MNIFTNCVTFTNTATLIFGVFVGFSFSILFVVGPTKKYWSSDPNISLKDLNYDYDSSEEKFPDYGNEYQQDRVQDLENSTVANRLYDEPDKLFKEPFRHSQGFEDDKPLSFMLHENLCIEHVYDDTYVIVENLRFMLYPHSPQTPIYFGCKFKRYVEQGYMLGAAGYVLSREAVRRFVEIGIPNKEMCLDGDKGLEDVEMGKCLEKINVLAGDSRDSAGRGRFFPFLPEKHLLPNTNTWYYQYLYYKTDEGLDCCSDNAVTFHEVSPNQMFVFEYLIYHLRPYGIVRIPQTLPDKISTSVESFVYTEVEANTELP